MATKVYNFNYNFYDAEASFKVDLEKFTEEKANDTLEFYVWDYDKEENPVDAVLKKYAMKAIEIATFNSYNVSGVIDEFAEKEGYYPVDGSMGIELISVSEYEFNEELLRVEISVIN